MTSAEDVLRRRLATQRLTSAPAPDPLDVVRLLTCVQAQDAPLARYSVGLRASTTDDLRVRSLIDSGAVIRTHVLRPTWHLVAADDVRWLIDLTGAKVERALAARHRQLGLDARTVEGVLDAILGLLSHQNHLTRKQIGPELAASGRAESGERLGHLLLTAEVRGLICSGPMRGNEHSYAVLDEWVPARKELDRDEAVRLLVHRFFAGHGPASVRDLVRWAAVTQSEVKAALLDLGGDLESTEVAGSTLWFDPSASEKDVARSSAFLLPTFDEAFLTYPDLGFSRARNHPHGDRPHSFAEAGGGVVVYDLQDVGWWKRTVSAHRIDVRVALSDHVGRTERREITTSAEVLAEFVSRDLRLQLVQDDTDSDAARQPRL